MRILIIEDSIRTADYLKKGLTENGFVVDAMHRGNDGLHCALTINYDLIVLDVMLPELDGWSILSELRRKGQQTPVLFLTACDKVQDRVRGLTLGADDYLIKPFAFSELLARIYAILKRGQVTQTGKIKIADLEIDAASRKVMRGETLIDLTPKEFVLLNYLAQSPGQVLSRSTIAEHVWDINFESDRNIVDVAILRLRAKVDDPFAKKLIHTVRGAGYVFEERE